MTSLLYLIVAGVLGTLIGSFANVVIHRLPKGQSIAFPSSHCPNCHHQLRWHELIPIGSYLIQRGRCRSCGQRISIRYPLVEALVGTGFVVLTLRWLPATYGPTVVPLLALFAALVMLSAIDLDTYLLPDSLTLPATVAALAGAWLYHPSNGLPTPLEAAIGAAAGAGVITLINRIGSLVLRRFADTRERLWPLGFDQANLATLGGALGGWFVGLAVAAASLLANLVSRRTLRIPEPLLFGLVLVALLLSTTGWTVDIAASAGGAVIATGVAALAGALLWWLRELAGGPEATPDDDENDEPIAMGFGDAKLAAVLGAMLGWEKLLVGIFLAVSLGALGGMLGRLLGGGRMIPFGPYLVAGALLALFFGDSVIAWYLGLLGIDPTVS